MERIAVVTPYCREATEVLSRAHESVLAQGPGVEHVMVADGHPQGEVAKWDVRHVVLPRAHGDNGNTPRAIGSLLARAGGCGYIAYLDADNWYHPGHLASLVELQRTAGADVCASLRTFHDLEGRELPGVRDAGELRRLHVDTSCFLLHRSAFRCISLWSDMPKPLGPICDRVFLAGIRKMNLRVAHSDRPTVAFRSQYAAHYRAAGREPPPGAKEDVAEGAVRWLSSLEGVRETVDRLGFFPL
jgi:glycosyltransferase involved in cell wall biosynthesis